MNSSSTEIDNIHVRVSVGILASAPDIGLEVGWRIADCLEPDHTKYRLARSVRVPLDRRLTLGVPVDARQ